MPNRLEKFKAMLPIVKDKGIITGFIPDDWQTTSKYHTILREGDNHYHACCQDPRNWEPFGELHILCPGDPYYLLQFRHTRKVRCTCGTNIIATYYTRMPDDPISSDRCQRREAHWSPDSTCNGCQYHTRGDNVR